MKTIRYASLLLGLTLLVGCEGFDPSKPMQVGPFCWNCDQSTTKSIQPGTYGYGTPILKSTQMVVSEDVDTVAALLKRGFGYATTDELRSESNGEWLISSDMYGWSATPGTHYMMRQPLQDGTRGYMELEVTKQGAGSVIDITVAIMIQKESEKATVESRVDFLAQMLKDNVKTVLGQ